MTDLATLIDKRIYFDTNLFIYFLEKDTAFFNRTLPFFELLANRQARGITSDLVLAELLVKPIMDNDSQSIDKIKNLLLNPRYFEILGHNRETFELASHIRANQRLKMVDALHIATAMLNHCDVFATQDIQIIRRVSGIRVIGI